MCYCTQLIFKFSVETGSPYVIQAGLKLLTSSNPPTLASQSAGITGINHCAWPQNQILNMRVSICRGERGVIPLLTHCMDLRQGSYLKRHGPTSSSSSPSHSSQVSFLKECSQMTLSMCVWPESDSVFVHPTYCSSITNALGMRNAPFSSNTNKTAFFF